MANTAIPAPNHEVAKLSLISGFAWSHKSVGGQDSAKITEAVTDATSTTMKTITNVLVRVTKIP